MTHGISHVEILNPQLLDSLKSTHISAAVARLFDPACKCFILSLLNTGQIQLPKDPRRLLSLVQPYLMVQVYIPTGKSFTLEICFSDHTNTKRRIVLANTREVVRSQLHVRLPNVTIKREVWLNLCVDVATAAKLFFPGCVYKCMDQIRVGAVCKIRRIFCMRKRVLDTTGDPEAEAQEYEYDLIPAAFEFPKGINVVNQFVDCANWRVPDEKWFATEPRTRRKGKEDLLPEIGKDIFARKYRSLNGKSNREPVQRPGLKPIYPRSPSNEKADISRAPEPPAVLLSPTTDFPAVSKLPPRSLPTQSIFSFPESPRRALDYLPNVFREYTEVRHFTPPFVNVMSEGQPVLYDPVLRAYNPFR